MLKQVKQFYGLHKADHTTQHNKKGAENRLTMLRRQTIEQTSNKMVPCKTETDPWEQKAREHSKHIEIELN